MIDTKTSSPAPARTQHPPAVRGKSPKAQSIVAHGNGALLSHPVLPEPTALAAPARATSALAPPVRANAFVVECMEHPAPLLTADQAAARARVPRGTLVWAIKRSAWNNGPKSFVKIGGLHFRRVPREEIPEVGEDPRPRQATWMPLKGTVLPPAPTPPMPAAKAPPYQTRPRFRGELTAINPHVVGAAALITHQARPT